MTSFIQNDHVSEGDNLQHVGLGRPKKPKNYKSTTIIVTDGEEVEHKPLSTEDLYNSGRLDQSRVEKRFANLNEKDNEVKHMRNKPVAGIALPGMTLGQVKLRSLKSENSRPSNEEKDESSEPVANGKDGIFSQVKLKAVTPTTTEDTVKLIPPQNSLENSQNSDYENQDGNNIRPGLLKDNSFMQDEMKKRKQRRQPCLPTNEASQQNQELPSFEKQRSNQNNSVPKIKTFPSVSPRKRSIETSPSNCFDETPFMRKPVPGKISQTENPIDQMAPTENNRQTTHFRKLDSSSLSTNNSEPTGSSHHNDKRMNNFTGGTETQSTTIGRKSFSENEPGANVQIRRSSVPEKEEQNISYFSKIQESRSSKIENEIHHLDRQRKSNQVDSLSKSCKGSDISVPRSESKKEIERANRKSHSSALSTTSEHSEAPTSASSEGHSEAISGKHIYKKSGNASSPRKLSSSSSASGCSLRDKSESKKDSSNSDSTSAKQKYTSTK
ncbi:unnamed protein product [Hymenolepis diminuta]|uniref:Shugoshin_C domain-containing protein n=1 Tax=Hymenolepis diminuta TaxID=6216 RepID=A0A0R3SBW5_HYMDI|nr:unnamed protein product [Hymenolepis diminuta]